MRTALRRPFVALITIAATAAGLSLFSPVKAADAGQPALMNLIAQASQRLTLADTVARYKWSKSQDITDPPRETALA